MAIKTKTIKFLPSTDPAVDAYRIRIYADPGTFSEGDPNDQIDDTVAESGYVEVTTDTLTQEPTAAGTYDIFITAYDSGLDVESDPLEAADVEFETYTTEASMATITIDPTGTGLFRASGYAPDSGGFGTGGDTVTNQTAQFMALLQAAADYYQTNGVIATVEIDVPEILLEEWPVNSSGQCAVIYSGVRLRGSEGIIFPRIKIDSTETGNTSLMRNAQFNVSADPDVTFTGGTIVRTAGSFVTEGFRAGEVVKIDGSTSNDGEYTITTVAATVLTCDTTFTLEGPKDHTGITIATKIVDFHISDLRLDGNKSRTAVANWGTKENEGLDLKFPSNCSVKNMWIHDVGTDALDFDNPSKSIIVEDVRLEDNGGCGVHWGGSSDGSQVIHVNNVRGFNNSHYRFQSSVTAVRKAAGLISYSGEGATVSNITSTGDARAVTHVGQNADTNYAAGLISNINVINPGTGAAGIIYTATTSTSSTDDITVSAAGKTFSRDAGDFVAEGYVAGMYIITSGFVNGDNNGTMLIDTVATTLITLDAGETLADEGPTQIDTGLVLNGNWQDPATEAVPNGSGQGVYIEGGNGVSVTNVTLEIGRVTLEGEAAVLLKSTGNHIVDNVVAKNCHRGVWMVDPSNTTVTGINASNCDNAGVFVKHTGTPAQWSRVANATIRQTTDTHAIVCDGAEKMIFSDCCAFNHSNSLISFQNLSGRLGTDINVIGGGAYDCKLIWHCLGAYTNLTFKNVDFSQGTATLYTSTNNQPFRYSGANPTNVFMENCSFQNPAKDEVSSTTYSTSLTCRGEVLWLDNTAGGAAAVTATTTFDTNAFWGEGQLITIVNADASLNISFTETSTDLHLSAATVDLAPGNSLVLRKHSDGDWYQINGAN